MEIDIQERILNDFGRDSSIAIGLIEAFEKKLELSPRVTRCIIYLSKGDISKLRKAIRDAETDWRDVIVTAESFTFEFNNPFKKI